MSTRAASLSIVIPAHNEERVIARTLDAVLRGAEAGEFEVVVACNGCTDRTVEIVAGYAPRVQAVLVAAASKVAALNAGEQAVSAFPRVFLDADVEVDAATLRAVRDALAPPGPLAAAPRVEFVLDACSWPVRAYYDVWSRLPWISAGLLGTGFYALSRAGRERFGAFPALVADDLFVRRLFTPAERTTVAGSFRVRPPRDLASLLRAKARVYAGNRQYSAAQTAGLLPTATAVSRGSNGSTGSTAAALVGLAASPRWWPRLVAYVAVVTVARVRGEFRVRAGNTGRWDQDATGRATE